MDKKYFFWLYLRNIKGTFIEGFAPLDWEYAAPMFWLGHILLLPITLTIIPFVKTLIDFFSRKSMTNDSIEIKKAEINNFDQSQMLGLLKSLSDYQPASNSSNYLYQELSDVIVSKQEKLEKWRHEQAYLLAVDQLGFKCIADAEEVFQPKYLAKLPLDEEHQRLLNTRCDEKENDLTTSLLQQQKKAITGYMDQEKNKGKKSLQVILGLFTPPASKRKQNDSLEPQVPSI